MKRIISACLTALMLFGAAPFSFARAVVTQTRLTREVEGFPTTFDFKGLTIDSSFLINEFNNGVQHAGEESLAYQRHREDFWNLYVQNASQWENRIFEETAGLESISTVKGLQYAYAHPETYTMHRITAENAAEIELLQLSENTKQNMRDAIARGGSVLTPDRPVQMGTWTGVIYIVTENNEARYAIGEQANGGYTTREMENRNLIAMRDCDRPMVVQNFLIPVAYAQAADCASPYVIARTQTGDNEFAYIEQYAGKKLCSMNAELKERIKSNRDASGGPIENREAQWIEELYGEPCIADHNGVPFNLGGIEHNFILASHGAKFFSPGRYEYWKTYQHLENELEVKFRTPIDLPFERCTAPSEWKYGRCFAGGEFFDRKQVHPFFGTLAYDDIRGDTAVAMGMYNPQTREVYTLRGTIHKKYLSSQKVQGRYVPELLGYPTEDAGPVGESVKGSIGRRQSFTNGSLFEAYEPWWWQKNEDDLAALLAKNAVDIDTYALSGAWEDEFDRLGGLAVLGFPQSDAAPGLSSPTVVQKFETQKCSQIAGGIQCAQRTVAGDVKNGFDAMVESFLPLPMAYAAFQLNAMIDGYDRFLTLIEEAQDTPGDRMELCYAYDIQSTVLHVNAFGSDTNIPCVIPRSLAYYQAQVPYVQGAKRELEERRVQLIAKLTQIHESLATHLTNANYEPAEWLGYLAADIAVLVFEPAVKFGVETAKKIAVRMAERYGSELLALRGEAALVHSNLAVVFRAESLALGEEAQEKFFEEAVDQALVKAAKRSESTQFTPGGNPIKYLLNDKNTRGAEGEILTEFGKSSFYSEVSGDKKIFRILGVFRRGIEDKEFHATNTLLDQYFFAGGHKSLLDKVGVDDIIEPETIGWLNAGGHFKDSKWGSMIKRIANGVSKKPIWERIEIIYLPGERPGNITSFNIWVPLE